MSLRTCLDCDAPTTKTRCKSCQAKMDADRDRRRAAARGDRYGAQHQAQREAWRPYVEAGRVRCRRCKHPIAPDAPWHLGHPDEECADPTAPEHELCNTSAAGRLGHA